MRVQGWESLLYEHFKKAKTTSFAWGTNDCATWCADWVHAATNADPAAQWRGHYSTQEELQTMMQAKGFATAENIADGAGYQSVSVNFAQRGDIVLHPTADSLGICDGIWSHFLTINGMTRVPTHSCRKAWRI